MTCTFVMILSFYVNPCQVTHIEPFDDGTKCVIQFVGGRQKSTHEMTCEEIVKKLNG